MLRAYSAVALVLFLVGCQSPPPNMTDPFVPGMKRIPPPATGSIGAPPAADPYYQPQGVPSVGPQGAAPATVTPGAFGMQASPDAAMMTTTNIQPWQPSERAAAPGSLGPLAVGQSAAPGAARMTISDSRGVFVGDPDQPVGTGVYQAAAVTPVARPITPNVTPGYAQPAAHYVSEPAPRVFETGARSSSGLNLQGVPVNDGTQTYAQQRFVPTAQYRNAPAPIYTGQQTPQHQLVEIGTLPPAGSQPQQPGLVATAAHMQTLETNGVSTAGWTVVAPNQPGGISSQAGATQSFNDPRLYGYDPNYAWLQGKLQYSAAEQRWKLRYIPHDAAGGVDQFGGSVTLSNSASLDGLNSGSLVRVFGSLGARPVGSPDFAPVYHVSQVQAVQ